jgi:sigma-54-specific transcriptional regulator
MVTAGCMHQCVFDVAELSSAITLVFLLCIADFILSVLLTLPNSNTAMLSIRAKALVFNDKRSIDLLALADRIAPTDATVLIIGETGTGKELLARYVHAHSGRTGVFIAVNCGAFSETLIDAELFGHEVGAFTGATHARQGWFEAANGGTLFLDEIGDLPLNMQVKLLRVIQERQIVRLGSRRSTPIDVRLIAATNIDLLGAVYARRFRADLYYRLGVATLELPPLCERRGDILPLAEHFSQYFAEKLHTDQVVITGEAQEVLLAYDWPGNIRELENTIHYALIVTRNGRMQAEDLRIGHRPIRVRTLTPEMPVTSGPAPTRINDGEHLTATSETDFSSATESENDLPDKGQAQLAVRDGLQGRFIKIIEELLDAGEAGAFGLIEASVVGAALNIASNNQTQTARTLGISRNVLRTLLKRHGFLLHEI